MTGVSDNATGRFTADASCRAVTTSPGSGKILGALPNSGSLMR